MPIKRATLKELRERGIPILRSYVQFHPKPTPHQMLQKFLDASSKSQELING